MNDDLQKRYAEWKARVSDPNNKRRNMSHERYNHYIALHEERDNSKIAKTMKVKIMTPWGEFSSVTEARKAGNISEDTLRRRIQKGLEGYARIGNTNNKKFGKPIQTPFGKFNSKVEAATYAEKNNIMLNASKKIAKFLKNDPENYYYI